MSSVFANKMKIKFVFSFKSISLLFTQLCVPPLTNYLKQQQFASIVITLYNSFAYNNSCSPDLYSRDLRTTIILFSRNGSSHKTDWILSEPHVFTQDWPNFYWINISYSVLPFISQSTQSDKCTWRRMFLPSRNLYKCKQVVCFYQFF